MAGEALHSCRSATDDELSYWYYRHSNVFVAENHHIWEYSQRKPKKRFGQLIQSPYTSIQEMLSHHKDEVTDEMLRQTEGWQEPQDTFSSEDELAKNHGNGAVPQLSSPVRLPPVGNFALSPGTLAASQRGRGSPGKAVR